MKSKRTESDQLLLEVAKSLFNEKDASIHIPYGATKDRLKFLEENTASSISFASDSEDLNNEISENSKIIPDAFIPKKKAQYALSFNDRSDRRKQIEILNGSSKLYSKMMLIQANNGDLSKRIGELRKARVKLIESETIRAVISLDSSGQGNYLMVLTQEEIHDEVLFIDAEGLDGGKPLTSDQIIEIIENPNKGKGRTRYVSAKELLGNLNGDLLPKKYIKSPEDQQLDNYYEQLGTKENVIIVQLSDYPLYIIRTPPTPQLTDERSKGRKDYKLKPYDVKVLLSQDISGNHRLDVENCKSESVSLSKIEEKYFLQNGDLLLGIRGPYLGTLHYFHDIYDGAQIIACSDIAILRFESLYDAGVVYAFLKASPFGLQEIKKSALMDYVPSLSSSEIESIRVPGIRKNLKNGNAVKKFEKSISDFIENEKLQFIKQGEIQKEITKNIDSMSSFWS